MKTLAQSVQPVLEGFFRSGHAQRLVQGIMEKMLKLNVRTHNIQLAKHARVKISTEYDIVNCFLDRTVPTPRWNQTHSVLFVFWLKAAGLLVILKTT